MQVERQSERARCCGTERASHSLSWRTCGTQCPNGPLTLTRCGASCLFSWYCGSWSQWTIQGCLSTRAAVSLWWGSTWSIFDTRSYNGKKNNKINLNLCFSIAPDTAEYSSLASMTLFFPTSRPLGAKQFTQYDNLFKKSKNLGLCFLLPE